MSFRRDLAAMVGREFNLDQTATSLAAYARTLHAPVVGAYQVNCSDESERECTDAFYTGFVRHLLPDLSYWRHSAFRTINLGARHEPRALAVAENHFSTAQATTSWKLMVIKVNSHVSVVDTPSGPKFGKMDRYDRQSVFCGALHALLDGGPGLARTLPFVGQLADSFGAERVDALNDPAITHPKQRALKAAAINSQLQCRRVLDEARTLPLDSPTVFAVIGCVTLNRTQRDTELIVGATELDRRGKAEPSETEKWLSTVPADISLKTRGQTLRLE